MATTQVLPRELRLTAPPTMPQARSYLFKQQSSNFSYDPAISSTVQINIPRLQRSYLTKDSYLRFRLSFTKAFKGTEAGAGTISFDTPGALGLIDKIEVYDYLGSTLLESTSGHGQLTALLMDLNLNPIETGMHYNVSGGMRSGAVLLDVDGIPATAAGVDTPWIVSHPRSGAVISNNTVVNDGSKIPFSQFTTADYFEYAIPLFSFLGNNSSKFVPLHNGFTIMISLNQFATAFGACSGDGAALPAGTADGSLDASMSYKIDNVYYACQVLELGPAAESMLMSSSEGKPLVIPSKAFRNFVSSVPAASSTFRLDLNLNVASLTNILWMMRPDQDNANAGGKATIGKQNMKTLSTRIRNFLQSWYFQYGSSILPQTQGIQCLPPSNSGVKNGGHDEAYLELLKARHALNSESFDTLIDSKSFQRDIATEATDACRVLTTGANGLSSGKFAAGLDLELIPGRSQSLVCGMNTNGMNTSIYGTFDPTQYTKVGSARVDAWCEYDSFINISPGIATTVSF